MKRKYKYSNGKEIKEREYSYIPVRFIIAIIISILEVLAVIGIVVACCYYIPLFYLAALITHVFCVIKIIASDDNPDYKVPWVVFVLILPIVGFMLYFMFYSRKLKGRFIQRLKEFKRYEYQKDDSAYQHLVKENSVVGSHAKMLGTISSSQVFDHTKTTYFESGKSMKTSLLNDLSLAKKFIFMEYFIIDEGVFWSDILDVLAQKVKEGVTVRVVYDDIGCMATLSGSYYKTLRKMGIEAVCFSRLKGSADGEFNNRNHRKITVIDGKIGYTGGINIADEYIGEKIRFGEWKDTAIRLEGNAVWELTKLFLIDYGMNVKTLPQDNFDYYPNTQTDSNGYVIPFGDGPKPIYERSVGKSVIQNLFNSATKYVYVTTPYLIIDNDLCQTIENTAMRGVDVRIILPHIPDKKIVFEMSKSYYDRLIKAGVRIYEFELGFIHAKTYLSDDNYAMIGTINLDYRSLVHHFENGVLLYKCDAVEHIKQDVTKTLERSIEVTKQTNKTGVFRRLLRSIIKIFAPML